MLNPYRRCFNEDEALHYHRSVDSVRKPASILLGLHLPGISGAEVLRPIKEDPELQTIPVVICSASEQPEQVADCYMSGANSFLPKQVCHAEQYRDFYNLVRIWLEKIRLPNYPGEL